MVLKKEFKLPQIEVIQFDTKDVVTTSGDYLSNSIYSVDSIKNFFDIKV